MGVNNPRPENNELPLQAFQNITLKSNRSIACWHIKTNHSKGTVILFHGYGGQKSTMLDKSNKFIKLGYSTLLVDFMGSGGSEGNQTTIGFLEAAQVKTCFNYLKDQGESPIYLFGTSMGAVAILKAIKDYSISPKAIILECPFGSMYETVGARFKMMNVPIFPIAGFLVFWGGVQNGYWAFSHNPKEYAKSISCPTLLLYGAQDLKVSRREIKEIYANLNGKKKLKIYLEAGHENYLIKYQKQWLADVQNFLLQNS
ncbi:alpha/beta hydrolase [Adhaeribacter pallidiroseus]|uniref:alpha/beta hydrolase n=1 Tax=Adhaeribacter pallidiroseus TaxID=2072847 RepID=UPI0018F154B8|nr:alpha/beta hydrolase [Adhaeribacter pallidiroseus]